MRVTCYELNINMTNIKDFTGYNPTWCPGCGNWGILTALKQAFVQLGMGPDDIVVVFGIGCSGNMNDFLNGYGFHSLHGRAIPNAIGIKLANHKLPVIAIVGDGDCYGEGGNHLIHAARGNHDIKIIVHDNRVYGLTTGQTAPTSQKGYKTRSTPLGNIDQPINPLATVLSNGATFVAQSFAGDLNHLILMIKSAITHKGFSLLNVLQPCVTFNKINTFQYYLKRVYKLDGAYQQSNLKQAIEKSLELNEEKFPLGIIYQENRPTYTDFIEQIKGKPLVEKERFTNFELLEKLFI